MIWPVYVTLLVFAGLGTAFVLVLGMRGRVAGTEVSNRVGIVASAFVLVLWGIIGVNSFEIVTYAPDGSRQIDVIREMAILAMAGAGVMLASAMKATIEEIRADGGML